MKKLSTFCLFEFLTQTTDVVSETLIENLFPFKVISLSENVAIYLSIRKPFFADQSFSCQTTYVTYIYLTGTQITLFLYENPVLFPVLRLCRHITCRL